MGEKVYGLLGRKLGHSWSAPIHAALGCADYRLIELEPEELGAFLAREDIGGLNVTIPYKRDVMAYCDVLDPMAEAEIFRQFDTLRAGKTTVFVSHRLSSATDADDIIVMQCGRIIEEGDHKTLMEKGGAYYLSLIHI